MGYSLHLTIGSTDEATTEAAITASVSEWIDTLNASLSSRSETFLLYDDDGQVVGSVKPGNDRDIDRIIGACEALRAQRPDLIVELTDDFGTAHLPPTPAPTGPTTTTRATSATTEPPVVDWSPPPHRTVEQGFRLGRRDPAPPTPHMSSLRMSADSYTAGFGRSTPAVLAARVELTALDASGDELGRTIIDHWTEHLVDPQSDPNGRVSNFHGLAWDGTPERYTVEARFGLATPIGGTVDATRQGANWTLEVAPDPNDAVLYTAVLATFSDADGHPIAEILFPGRASRPYRGAWTAKKRVPRARSVKTELLGAILAGEPQRITVTL